MNDGIPDRRSIEQLEQQAREAISSAADPEDLERARVTFLGRKGRLTVALRSIGKLPADQRPLIGASINEAKERLDLLFERRLARLRAPDGDRGGAPGDASLPGRRGQEGGRHVLRRVISDAKEIFVRMGYSIAEGPDVELDYYNFEALNFPPDHPSRDAQDTFYINRDILLRTQTSPVQVRYMERHSPPLRIISPGRVYRNEVPDPSHAAEFFQVEGLCVDVDVSFSDLRADVAFFIHQFFGPEARVRFRPHFFPFTEPSAEVDMTCFSCRGSGCAVCKRTGWIEIMGAGMVHPNVFRCAGYDPEMVTGFAFGMGIDRIAMLKYGIDDIRRFLANDLRFLEQFWNDQSVGVRE